MVRHCPESKKRYTYLAEAESIIQPHIRCGTADKTLEDIRARRVPIQSPDTYNAV